MRWGRLIGLPLQEDKGLLEQAETTTGKMVQRPAGKKGKRDGNGFRSDSILVVIDAKVSEDPLNMMLTRCQTNSLDFQIRLESL